MEKEIKKLSKDQIFGLRSYKRATIFTLFFIIIASLWLKISLNPLWSFNDIIVEIVSLFIIIIFGIVANIKNDFPIFQLRNFKFTKNFNYSIVLFLTLLLIFIIYKNITNPDFITYLASLKLHDLITVIVFLLPVFLLIIYLIYIGIRLFDKDSNVNNKFEIYKESIEESLDKSKRFTINIIFIIMCLSIWIKVGLNNNINLYNVTTEVILLFAIITLFIVGNIDNKLPVFYNNYMYIDKYFIYSLLLPYFLIVIYTIFNSDFRILLNMAGFLQIISVLVSMAPLFFISSLIFYNANRNVYNRKTRNRVKKSIKVNKVRDNSVISLILTVLILFCLFYYSFTTIVPKYSISNILQVIIILIPLSVIIYLIIYSCIKEINK